VKRCTQRVKSTTRAAADASGTRTAAVRPGLAARPGGLALKVADGVRYGYQTPLEFPFWVGGLPPTRSLLCRPGAASVGGVVGLFKHLHLLGSQVSAWTTKPFR
jgi:hypothetical protein